MKKDFLTITPDSGEGSQEVTVAVPANTGNARSSTITIRGGGITRTITVKQEAKLANPVTLTMRINSQSGYGNYWGYETDKGLGEEEFGKDLTLENIRMLRIAPNADECFISLNMGFGWESDIIEGMSGDFTDISFRNWPYDVRDGDLSGTIYVQQEEIPFEIVERLS